MFLQVESYLINVGDFLGKGAYGATYKTTVINDKKVYAAKFLFPLVDSGKSIEREKKSFQIIKSLAHGCIPNIMCYNDFLTLEPSHPQYHQVYQMLAQVTSDKHFSQEVPITLILTEFVPGKDLKVLLNEGYVFPEEEMGKFISNMLSAISILQSKGIAHRDVKPANIILKDDKSEFVLVDFGLACYDELSCLPGGSLDYMTNELIFCRGNNISLRSLAMAGDGFAVGITGYRLANRKSPFDRNNAGIYGVSSYQRSQYHSNQINNFLSRIIFDYYLGAGYLLEQWHNP